MDGKTGITANDIARLSWRYLRQRVALTVVLANGGLLLAGICGIAGMTVPIFIGAVYSLVTDIALSVIWRRVAECSPESLTTFYTAVSGFRMLIALATMFVYYLATGRQDMFTFIMVFMTFYVVQLVHHTIFFARVSKNS